MHCKYCIHFQYARIREKRTRWCKIKNKYLKGTDLACDDLEISNKFYCQERNQWTYFIACLKVLRHTDACSGCLEIRNILDLFRGRSDLLEKIEKVKSEESTRPKLMRKTT